MAGQSVWMRPGREAVAALEVADTEAAVEEEEVADTPVEAEEEVGQEVYGMCSWHPSGCKQIKIWWIVWTDCDGTWQSVFVSRATKLTAYDILYLVLKKISPLSIPTGGGGYGSGDRSYSGSDRGYTGGYKSGGGGGYNRDRYVVPFLSKAYSDALIIFPLLMQ